MITWASMTNCIITWIILVHSNITWASPKHLKIIWIGLTIIPSNNLNRAWHTLEIIWISLTHQIILRLLLKQNKKHLIWNTLFAICSSEIFHRYNILVPDDFFGRIERHVVQCLQLRRTAFVQRNLQVQISGSCCLSQYTFLIGWNLVNSSLFDPRETQFLFQRLSIAIQRGNAVSVRATLGSIPDYTWKLCCSSCRPDWQLSRCQSIVV